MNLTLFILLTAGPIGATDVIYFHLYKFRLYARPQSFSEEWTHIARGTVVPILFTMLLLGRPQGAMFYFVLALFAFESLNSLIDVMVEPASRKPIGVPPAELAVHLIGSMLMGAAFGNFVISGWSTRHAPSAFVPWPSGAFPPGFILAARGAVVISVALVIFEAALFFRARFSSRA
jgi:hypothetical protein